MGHYREVKKMRKSFAATLHEKMKTDDRIFLIVGDLGFGLFNEIRKDFPDRFINANAAEMAMMGIGVGLAMQGKIPFVYSITPFLLFRTAETIRNYVNHESIPVKLIGSGRDDNYHEDGFSHFAGDDKDLLKILPNVKSYWPQSKEEIPDLVQVAIETPKPFYINLRR
jgi:transketolase